MNADLVIADLPAEADWPTLKIDPNLTPADALAQFQKPMRARALLEPGEPRETTFRARFAEELAPHVIDGKVNLTPELIEVKRAKVQKQIDDEYYKATRDGQVWRQVAGVVLTQAVRDAQTPPSWEGSLSFAASVTDRMIARQLDIVERADARQWVKDATAVEVLARYRTAQDKSDKALIAVLEGGAMPGVGPVSDEDAAALADFIALRDARRLARVPPALVDHVKAYKLALAPTLAERISQAAGALNSADINAPTYGYSKGDAPELAAGRRR